MAGTASSAASALQSLLSANASDAKANDQQDAQSLMYAARMKYLQDDDQVQPDRLFMTRKQAHKVAQQGQTKLASLRKLDMGSGSQSPNPQQQNHYPHQSYQSHRKLHHAGDAGANTLPASWKRSQWLLDDRQHTWVPVTQAGCHFWQSQESGECRSTPPPGWESRRHPGLARDDELEQQGHADDEEDPPFPESFAFLNPSPAQERK